MWHMLGVVVLSPAKERSEQGQIAVRKTSHKFRTAVATITTFALVKRRVAYPIGYRATSRAASAYMPIGAARSGDRVNRSVLLHITAAFMSA